MTIMIRFLHKTVATMKKSDTDYRENDTDYEENNGDYEMTCYNDETDDCLSECKWRGKTTEYVYFSIYTQCSNIS